MAAMDIDQPLDSIIAKRTKLRKPKAKGPTVLKGASKNKTLKVVLQNKQRGQGVLKAGVKTPYTRVREPILLSISDFFMSAMLFDATAQSSSGQMEA